MKALRITDFGTEATLADLPAPVPGPGQVVVDVVAVANPLDLKIASGAMHDYFPAALPYVLGTDFSGRVATPGTGWQIGDPVIGRLDPVDGGAFAEQLVIDAAHLVPAPSGISLEAAAGIPTASGDGVAIAEKLGADQVLDYRQVAFDSRLDGIDVVLHTVGGEVGARSQQVLKPGGLLVTTLPRQRGDLRLPQLGRGPAGKGGGTGCRSARRPRVSAGRRRAGARLPRRRPRRGKVLLSVA